MNDLTEKATQINEWMNPKWRSLKSRISPAFFLIFTIGAVLRIWNYGKPDLWIDESVAQWAASTSWSEFFYRNYYYLNNSPLFFVFAKISALLFGMTPWSLRLPSIIAGVISLPIVYRIGKEAGNSILGIAAMLFFAIHPWFIEISQNAKPYSFAILFALLSNWALIYLFSGGRPFAWVFWGVSMGLLAYCNFLFIIYNFFQILICLIIVFFHKCPNPRFLDQFKISLFLFIVTILPCLPQFFLIFTRRERLVYDFPIHWIYPLQIFMPDILCLFGIIISFVLTGFVYSSIGLTERLKKSPQNLYWVKNFWLPCYLFPWPFFGLAALVSGIPTFLEFRYLVIYQVSVVFLLAWPISCFKDRLIRFYCMILPVFLVFFFYFKPSHWQSEPVSGFKTEEWSRVCQHLQNFSHPGSLILLRSGFIESDKKIKEHPIDRELESMLCCPLQNYQLKEGQAVSSLPYHWDDRTIRTIIADREIRSARMTNDLWVIVRRDPAADSFAHQIEKFLIQAGFQKDQAAVIPSFRGILLDRYIRIKDTSY
jgi:uncharacterized membrane protein